METSTDDYVMTLHLATCIIFQSVFGCLLHFPGKYLMEVITKLEQSIERVVYEHLMKSHELIKSKLITKEEPEIIKIDTKLKEISCKLRELAIITKKKK